ncbi:UNVERIFIED_CONTAM: hypothetical protein FKN15_006911 [Acipenser sinensis]
MVNDDIRKYNGRVLAGYDFSARGSHELSLQAGEPVKVLEPHDKRGSPEWSLVEARGQRGYAPSNYLMVILRLSPLVSAVNPNVAAPRSSDSVLCAVNPNVAAPRSSDSVLSAVNPNVAAPRSSDSVLSAVDPNVAAPRSSDLVLSAVNPNVTAPRSSDSVLSAVNPNVAAPRSSDSVLSAVN